MPQLTYRMFLFVFVLASLAVVRTVTRRCHHEIRLCPVHRVRQPTALTAFHRSGQTFDLAGAARRQL